MPRSIVPLGFIEPMLPTLVDKAPEGEAWVHEINYGYRTQLAIAGKGSSAYTRNGYDWTDKYGMVVAAARALKCRSAVIDGEICVQNAAGVTDFKALRSAIGRSPERLMLFAFDILALDGRDLRAEPLPAHGSWLVLEHDASKSARVFGLTSCSILLRSITVQT